MPDIKKNGDQLSSQLVPSVLFMYFTIPTKVIMVDCINVLGQLIKGETFTVARYFWEN